MNLPPPLRLTGREPEITGPELIRWLKAQGAKPVEPAMKRRLMASGHWGMPAE